MTVGEMHLAIQQGVDKINSFQADLLLPQEIDLELNQLNNIRILQNRCLVAGEELLSDLLSQNQSLMSLNKRSILFLKGMAMGLSV